MDITKEKNKQVRTKKKAQKGQIYIKDENGNVTFINIENLKINSLNGETTLFEFITDLEKTKQELIDVNTAIIRSLENAKFIDSTKSYIECTLENGYIIAYNKLDGTIVENPDIATLTNRCYTIEDDEVKLDVEKRKKKVLEV